MSEILKTFLVKYGKQWDGREALDIVGKTPTEAAAAVVQDYALPLSTDEFLSHFYAMLSDQ